MIRIAGVRFKAAGKIYDFSAENLDLSLGDAVIVETEQGLGFATVATPVREQKTPYTGFPLKKMLRLAQPDDFLRVEENQQIEEKAAHFCKKEVENLSLSMNLFSVESTFDASKLTFFFTSEGRVDFRQLVKNLVKEFRVRIEMRQVGIRHQAKMCGGIGRCGRQTCCSAFIEKFEPVSIRMAKEQGLSLNPTKISGLCGRLMCCLTYENSTYRDLKSGVPKVGKLVETPKGKGRVTRHNVIAGRMAVRLEDGLEVEFCVAEVKSLHPSPHSHGLPVQLPEDLSEGMDEGLETELFDDPE
ncbi:stage 0 sporulation family protein [Desulfobotulus sp.]|jgi:cell fate regulator YaaT (PSP1 superfamily)|uniref:PSP1 domain-containing protein n=1 Tax=Desulfobotulus sp. TaxID=1940337 RepID=UPI002A36CCE6|nr:stage 0 sporulation family protein [Desulfobotulus sp.]MDY0161823.1 stage 0 sporulation family protein [Desulfobotulus sp.]